ncbi:hypothetical protein BCL57_003264 [Agromyces flavus]|uniref:Uncharacterized protein n=1 Tax=Agromyces flavus TaxID=589382 RepID=A0A1H1NJN6_9MICO|nr:hypothetical protein [Agromyces flavus]MCP2369081.1 hypothetical protein [Agromyces flavus]GGI48559.1 hypothetical protein GCM10010932_32470 [Agromyces flavus]SDR99206.1 hypothetical protein SAMN04489721_0607 [Agromyces flavus]
MTRVLEPTQTDATIPADPTIGFRRRVAAIALPTAFAVHLATNSMYAWISTSSGLSDSASTAEMLKMFALFPTQTLVGTLLAQIGCLLAILGLPAALRVLRPAKPRLALWAVSLTLLAYVCYFGILFTNYDIVALATSQVDAAAALAASPAQAWSAPFYLLFAVGNLAGTLLLGLAIILGGRRVGVPWWAGLLVIGWTFGHVVNIVGGGEWFAVAGGALEVAGLVLVASAVLRLSNAGWRSRG